MADDKYVTVRVTNPSRGKKMAKRKGRRRARRSNPGINWNKVGIDFAGVAVGAMISGRVRDMVDKSLAGANVQPQTRGVLKIGAAAGGVVLAHYLEEMPDLKDWPVGPFMYTAIGATLQDGYEDIRAANAPAQQLPNQQGMGRNYRSRSRRTQRGTLATRDGMQGSYGRNQRGTLLSDMGGSFEHPEQMTYMQMTHR